MDANRGDKDATYLEIAKCTFPAPVRQACYFSTGCLAGLSGATALQLATTGRLPDLGALVKNPAILKAGVRFWTFDAVKKNATDSIPVALKGAIGGAAGGVVEECMHAWVRGQRPVSRTVLSQMLRLYLCFGTYTYLSTELSPDRLPPKPFWYCWAMGAVAGAFGNLTTSAFVEKLSGRTLVMAAPKGALQIGTVIAVQVTSCAALLEWAGAPP